MRAELKTNIIRKPFICKPIEAKDHHGLIVNNTKFSKDEQFRNKTTKFANDDSSIKEFYKLNGADDLCSFEEFLNHHVQLLDRKSCAKCFITSDADTLNLARNILQIGDPIEIISQQEFLAA